ncbi:TolC family protein [Malaciobacter mytili]|uniref:TolC family protein n=1 Tax=Malaciobacter mytili TaxID=603050 RepID=UPI003A858910
MITIIITVINIQKLQAIDYSGLKQLLIENSKELQIKKYNIDIEKEELNIIDSQSYPSISFGFNIEKSNLLEKKITSTSVGSSSLTTDNLKKSYSYINLNYNLYSFGRIEQKKQKQKHIINVSSYEYCLTKKNLILKLLEYYYNLLNSKNRINYLLKVLDLKSKLYKNKEKLFKNGNISKFEVSQTAIEIAELYSNINEDKKELENILNQISIFTNYNFKKDDEFESLEIASSKEVNFEDTINAKNIISKINAKKSEIYLYEKEFLPTLDFYSKYDFYGYDSHSYRTSLSALRKNSYKFGLVLSLNIFDGFKTTSLKRKTLLQLKQLQKQYEMQRDKFNYEIKTLKENFKLEKSIFQNKTKSLKLAFENTINSTKLYKQGEITKIDEINKKIENIYKQLELQKSKEKLAYESTKKLILLEDEKCIVH